MELIIGLLGLIIVICFFVLTSKAASCANYLKKIEGYLKPFNCGNCGKTFNGKQSVCPHCGSKIKWK